jgi:hypothetical protein
MKKIQITGAVFTLILGSFFHFIYDISGQNAIVGIFSAVNESIWEHTKLLFFPALIFAVIEYFLYGKNIDNFIAVKSASFLIGIFSIIIAFYTFEGVFGNHYLIVDLIIFLLSVVLSFLFVAKHLEKDVLSSKPFQIAGIITTAALILLYAVFTFYPPNIPLFISY